MAPKPLALEDEFPLAPLSPCESNMAAWYVGWNPLLGLPTCRPLRLPKTAVISLDTPQSCHVKDPGIRLVPAGGGGWGRKKEAANDPAALGSVLVPGNLPNIRVGVFPSLVCELS